jgi:hypothetical protein
MWNERDASMLTQQSISLAEEIRTWPGVTAVGTGGGHEQFMVERIEIGHLHGGKVAHLPLPRRIHDVLIAAGQVSPHPVLPQSGWVQRVIAGPEDARDVLGLFRMNYYRAVKRQATGVRHHD